MSAPHGPITRRKSRLCRFSVVIPHSATTIPGAVKALSRPTARRLRHQESDAKQLGLALGIDEANGLVFRFAIETGATGNVERVVFLAPRAKTVTQNVLGRFRLRFQCGSNGHPCYRDELGTVEIGATSRSHT